MSMLNDGREVRCDGAGCTSETCWPIALHPVERDMRAAERPAAGWLSVAVNQRSRHFCPLCSTIFLRSISNDLPVLEKIGSRSKNGAQRDSAQRV